MTGPGDEQLREDVESYATQQNDEAWDRALDDGTCSFEEWEEREDAMEEIRNEAYGVDDK